MAFGEKQAISDYKIVMSFFDLAGDGLLASEWHLEHVSVCSEESD
jgi:hypothetical protein